MRNLNAFETIEVSGGIVHVNSYGQNCFQIDFYGNEGNFNLNNLSANGDSILVSMGESNFISVNGTQYPLTNQTIGNTSVYTFDTTWGTSVTLYL
jgi:hypothetical protein